MCYFVKTVYSSGEKACLIRLKIFFRLTVNQNMYVQCSECEISEILHFNRHLFCE
jgi:hypothetical protein